MNENNLGPKILNIRIKHKRINENKFNTNKIQSSISQTSGDNQYFFERRIVTKGNTPLSFLAKKYKNIKDNNIFISKTKRINKYNPNNLIKEKELIIDTRSDFFNNHNLIKKKKKQLSNDEFKNKKSQTYKIGYKIKSDKILQINTNSVKYKNKNNKIGKNILEENQKKNKNKNQTQSGFYDPIKDNHFLPSFHHPQVTNSLYTILAMRKNQFMDAYNDAKEKERDSLPKVKQLQFLMDKTPMANFFSKKKDIRTFISPNNSPLPYISLLTDDYSISEKIRFQKIMDKLTKLKKCIEDNPKKEYDIAKEFLLSIGLYDIENFYIEKLKNFVDFVKGNYLINPSKNIKENILDILNGTTVIRPPISDIMDNINNNKQNEITDDKLFEETQKMKKILSDNNLENNKDIVKNFKKRVTKVIIKQNEELNNNKSEKETKEKFSPKKLKKSHRVQSVERLMTKKYQDIERNHSYSNLNEKQKEIILNYKGLPINLKRQKEIYKSNYDLQLDLVSKPKIVIDMLEQKFKDEEKTNQDMRAKTYASWSKDLREGKNPKLYGGKRNNSDYEELKKRNMLTEYICLMKAKNNFEISKLKEKYKL